MPHDRKKKRASKVSKRLVRGLKEFSKKLKSGKPIKAKRMNKAKAVGVFEEDMNGEMHLIGVVVDPMPIHWKWGKHLRPVTITWTEPTEI